MTAFWDMMPCSLVEVDWCFRGAYYLHHHGNHPDYGGSMYLWNGLFLWEYMEHITKGCHLHTCSHKNLKSRSLVFSQSHTQRWLLYFCI